jgi:hypothetical protein
MKKLQAINGAQKTLLAAIRNVFNNIISSFEITYIPNEHITINGHVVVLGDKCLFYMFIKSKLGK